MPCSPLGPENSKLGTSSAVVVLLVGMTDVSCAGPLPWVDGFVVQFVLSSGVVVLGVWLCISLVMFVVMGDIVGLVAAGTRIKHQNVIVSICIQLFQYLNIISLCSASVVRNAVVLVFLRRIIGYTILPSLRKFVLFSHTPFLLCNQYNNSFFDNFLLSVFSFYPHFASSWEYRIEYLIPVQVLIPIVWTCYWM